MRHNKKIPIGVALFLLGMILGISFMVFLASKKTQRSANAVEFRDDVAIIFAEGIIDDLNSQYRLESAESLYCLIGHEDENAIFIDELLQGGTIEQGFDYLIFDEDPPCQIPGSVGSLHTHPVELGCEPSLDDMFTFGEMRNPEPIINAIQCGINKIHIFKMPGKREDFSFKRVRWR